MHIKIQEGFKYYAGDSKFSQLLTKNMQYCISGFTVSVEQFEEKCKQHLIQYNRHLSKLLIFFYIKL